MKKIEWTRMQWYDWEVRLLTKRASAKDMEILREGIYLLKTMPLFASGTNQDRKYRNLKRIRRGG